MCSCQVFAKGEHARHAREEENAVISISKAMHTVNNSSVKQLPAGWWLLVIAGVVAVVGVVLVVLVTVFVPDLVLVVGAGSVGVVGVGCVGGVAVGVGGIHHVRATNTR